MVLSLMSIVKPASVSFAFFCRFEPPQNPPMIPAMTTRMAPILKMLSMDTFMLLVADTEELDGGVG